MHRPWRESPLIGKVWPGEQICLLTISLIIALKGVIRGILHLIAENKQMSNVIRASLDIKLFRLYIRTHFLLTIGRQCYRYTLCTADIGSVTSCQVGIRGPAITRGHRCGAKSVAKTLLQRSARSTNITELSPTSRGTAATGTPTDNCVGWFAITLWLFHWIWYVDFVISGRNFSWSLWHRWFCLV